MIDGNMVTGESKNDDDSCVKEALMQEGAHLMLPLHWLRAFAACEVPAVCGFKLCDPLCNDLKQQKQSWQGRPVSRARHCACLMKMSAPQSLGDVPKPECFRDDSESGNDSAVRKLCQFLTNKTLWKQLNDLCIEQACPAS